MIRLLLTFTLCLLSASVNAAPHYSITDLGTLGGFHGIALGLNNQGQIVGTFETAIQGAYLFTHKDKFPPICHAFLWENGNMHDLGKANMQMNSAANAINNHGEIVGRCGNEAAVWQNRKMAILPNIEIGASNWESMASAVNDKGQIVGASQFRACIWQGGKPIKLDELGGGRSAVTSINENGQMVGWSQVFGTRVGDPPPLNDIHAVLWNEDQVLDLCAKLPVPCDSQADCIANNGSIYGYAYCGSFASSHYSVFNNWSGQTATHTATFMRIRACNTIGDLVGDSNFISFVRLHGSMYDLNALLPVNSGWTIGTATAINDKGWIVGNGTHNGKVRAFLMTPQR